MLTRPKLALRRLRIVTLLIGIGLLVGSVAGPSMAASPSAEQTRATTPVTWNGWRGVTLGSTLQSAHTRLGGTLHHTATSGGCGDVLATRTGILDGNNYARPHKVGNISVTRKVRYPLGIRVSMKPGRRRSTGQAEQLPAAQRQPPRQRRLDPTRELGPGPHGHTLYFAYTDGSHTTAWAWPSTVRVARGEMEMNGC